MQRPELRPASLVDVPEIVAFWARSGENASRPPDRVESVARLVDRDPEALVLAVLDGRIVGTVVAGWDGWRANLYRLAVDPDQRGRGIGRMLIDRAERRLRGLGAERFCAMVLDENELGRAVWAAAGYIPQQEWRRWVKPA